MELQQVNNLPSVQFERKEKRMTFGQLSCLEMLKEHLKNNQPITLDEILEWHIKLSEKNGDKVLIRDFYDQTTQRWSYKHISKRDYMKSRWDAKTKACSYFKSVLGQCIIKGKLLAIPIIEID